MKKALRILVTALALLAVLAVPVLAKGPKGASPGRPKGAPRGRPDSASGGPPEWASASSPKGASNGPPAGGPPSGPRGKGKSNNASLTLVSKDASWDPVWPGPFGQLKYKISNPDGFQARLIVHGLAPDNWYMVTLQGEWVESDDTCSDTDVLLGNSPGLWAAKGCGAGTDFLGWTDVALFKTNAGGNANVVLPTASGLTPGVTACRPLAGLNTSPSLTNGTYTGVRVIVKDVNSTDPDCIDANKLIWGTHPVLYETQTMETFTVGP